MKDPILGAVIDLAILKKDGTIVDYGKRHNIWSSWAVNSSRQLRMATTNYNFYTHTQLGSELLTGTYTLSGNIVYRQTGNVIFNAASGMSVGDHVQFPTGEKAYVLSRSLSTIQISLSGSVPTPSQLIRNKTATQPFNSGEATGAYQTGEFASTVTTTPSSVSRSLSGLFAPALAPQTINTIIYNCFSTINGYVMLIPAITLNIGDSLIIRDFTNTLTLDIGPPRPFTNDDQIQGLSGSGTLQRFLHLTTDITTSTNIPNRILLMNNANKVSSISGIPYNSTTYVAASNIPTETITAIDMASDELPNITNNLTANTHVYGLVNIGGSDISQIILGYFSGATTAIINVINYDTPVNIPVNKVLSFKNTAQIFVETPY
jgi:ribosomal protein L27